MTLLDFYINMFNVISLRKKLVKIRQLYYDDYIKGIFYLEVKRQLLTFFKMFDLVEFYNKEIKNKIVK